jgi:protein TonB
VKTIWDIEHLDKPKTAFSVAIAPEPPPPPPPPAGGQKPHDVVIPPKKPTVHDLVQPMHIEKPVVRQETQAPGTDGPDGPGGDGPSDSTTDGPGDGPATQPVAPPPPPPVLPHNVAPSALEATRIAGDKLIEPTEVTKTTIQRSGKTKVVGSFKLCLTASGTIGDVSTLKSTGFPAYDETIASRIRGEWRYRPLMVNGQAIAVCTAVTFIYSQ